MRERRFERLIWTFRLSILPVLLRLLGSVGCFFTGAAEVIAALTDIIRVPLTEQSLTARSMLNG